MKMLVIIIFILPGMTNAQAIKDSIRDNYTHKNYENYLQKKRTGEIPNTSGLVTSTRSGGDALVNNNGGKTGTSHFTQSETSVLAFGSNVVIGFNDSGSRDGDANKFTGWSYSTDGGVTFTDGGTLPDHVTGDAGDPVLARDETTGRIYFSTLGFTDPKTIQVFSSDDNGATWSAPVNGTPGGNDEDKQWIVVDNFAGTGNGNVYLMSRRFGGPGADQGLYVFYSTDNGATFLPDGGVKIASSGQGSYIAVAPNHDVKIFWRDSPSKSILMCTSTDFATTFGAPVTAVSGLSGTESNGGLSLTGLRQGVATYNGFRSNTFPHAAINRVSGQIYVVYNDNPAGDDKADVFLITSEDDGATWSAPTLINDDGTTTDQWQPTIAVTPDGNNLGIFYYSREGDETDNNLFTFNGRTAEISGTTLTFSPSFQVSDVKSLPEFGRDNEVNVTYMGDYNTVYATNTAFHIVWADNRDDLPDGGDRKDPNVYYESIPIVGNTPPTALCTAVEEVADEDCQAFVTAEQVDDGSFDPDGGPVTLSLLPGGPYPLGITYVTLYVEDVDGGVSTCNTTITVIDRTDPVAPAPPADVYVQCFGDIPAPVDLTAMDNCDGAMTVSPYTQVTPGICTNKFELLRYWVFTDLGGNNTTVYQTITVNDDTPPVAPVPPADLNVQCASDVPAPFDLTAVDNCDGGITVSPEVEITPGKSVNDFTEVRTWTFSDVCGNTSSVSQTITVFDDTPPELTVISDPIVLWPPNHTYETIDIDQLFVSVTDNCSSLTKEDVYITSVSSDEVEDANGNGDGKTLNDIVIDSYCNLVDLRKERDGNGNGRVYTINLAVADENGNVGTAVCYVHVPHSLDVPVFDNGISYFEECDKQSLIRINENKSVELINYPNPFKGSSTIQFTLEKSNYTKLVVYNSLGIAVATLYDGMAEAEQVYKVEFKAFDLPAGVYFYHLQSGESINTMKKMMLIK